LNLPENVRLLQARYALDEFNLNVLELEHEHPFSNKPTKSPTLAEIGVQKSGSVYFISNSFTKIYMNEIINPIENSCVNQYEASLSLLRSPL